MPFNLQRAIKANKANWPIKVTALALATVLWAAVAAEEPTTQLVPVVLRVGTPSGRVISQPLPPVQALFSGSAREIIKLYSAPLVITQTIPDDHEGPAFTLSLGVQDISFNSNANVVVQDVRPRQINVMIDSAASRTVPIEPRFEVTADSGYSVVGVTMAPESVTVTGPAAQVRALGSVHTLPSQLTRLRSSVRDTILLDTTALLMARLAPGAVDLAVEISPIVERVLTAIPVRVVAASAGFWAPDPDRVAVTVRGPQSRLARLTADSVRVTVSPAGASTEQWAALRVRPPEDIDASATPDSVVIRRQDRA